MSSGASTSHSPGRPGRHVAVSFAAYLAGLAANLVVSIAVARTLGPRGAGLITLALVGPNVLALIGNLGLTRAIPHFLGRRPFGARRIVEWSLVVNLGCGLLLAAGYLVALPLLRAGVLANLPLHLAAIAAGVVPLEICLQDLMAVCQGYHRFGRRSAVLLTFRWLYVALAVPALIVWRADAAMVVAAGIAAYALANATGLILVRPLLRAEPDEPGSLADAGRLLRYGGRVHVSTVLMVLVLTVDLLLVNVLLGGSAEAWVGYYSRSGQVATVIIYFLMAAENVLFPRLSALAAERVPAAAAQFCRRGLWVGAGMVVAGELAARWLIVLPFGEEFAPSVVPLRILLPGALAVGFAQMLFGAFNALERPGVPATIAALGLGLITALDIVLIPRLGIVGAATASLVGYVGIAGAAVGWFARQTGVGPRELLLPKGEDLAALRGLVSRSA